MDSLCESENAANGEHYKEYHETRCGEIWLKCANCGEHFFDRYIECGSGG